MREGLAWGHQTEILVGLQTEQIHHLRDHLAMLTRQHHAGGERTAMTECLDDGGKLDRLRAGTQHDRDPGLIHRCLRSVAGILRAFLSRDLPGRGK